MDRRNVTEIPRRRVVPTVLIGSIGTRLSHVRTLNPIMVVTAERKIALPVVIAARTVAVRLIRGSHGSIESASLPSLCCLHAFSIPSSINSTLFSSILLVRCNE